MGVRQLVVLHENHLHHLLDRGAGGAVQRQSVAGRGHIRVRVVRCGGASIPAGAPGGRRRVRGRVLAVDLLLVALGGVDDQLQVALLDDLYMEVLNEVVDLRRELDVEEELAKLRLGERDAQERLALWSGLKC